MHINEITTDDNQDYNSPDDQLNEIEEHIQSAIDAARRLSRSNRNSRGGTGVGQIDSYLIPWLSRFIDDDQQPGSIASLRRLLS